MSIKSKLLPAISLAALVIILPFCLTQTIETGKHNGCDDGWTRIGKSTCLRLFLKVKKNWQDARKLCNGLGGRLFEPRDWSLDQRVRGWVVGEIIGARLHWKLKKDLGPWIGLNDIAEEGRWIYASNNEEFKLNKKTVFSSKQPDNSRGNQNCANYYYPRNYLAKLDDNFCSHKRSFLCEKPAGNATSGCVPQMEQCSEEFCTSLLFKI